MSYHYISVDEAKARKRKYEIGKLPGITVYANQVAW